jgi:hypothetical protein
LWHAKWHATARQPHYQGGLPHALATLAVTRQTVHKWLNEDAAAGLVEKQGFANWRWRGGL